MKQLPESSTITRPIRRTLALLVVASVWGANSAPAQEVERASQAQDLFLDRIEVQRVVVDLVVEKDGRPVTDLQRDEVRLFDEGEEVEILGFSTPGAPRLQAGVSSRLESGAGDSGSESQTPPDVSSEALSAEAPSTLVVYLDELHMKPIHRKRVLKEARKAAEDLIEAGGRVSVVAFDGQLRMLQEPTSDKKVLNDLFKQEMETMRVPMMAALADPIKAVRIVEQDMRNNTQSKSNGRTPAGTDPCVQVGGLATASADQAAAVAHQALGGLRLLIGSLGRFEGRKSVLLVSDGIPLVPGLEVFTYAMEMCDGTAKSQGIPHAIDTEAMGEAVNTRWNPHTARTEMMARDTTRSWHELAAYANAQQVSLYPVQSTGLQGLGSGGVDMPRGTISFTQAAEANPRDGLFLVADETGGEAFFNTNDFGAAMVEAASDVDSVYQLTFEPRWESAESAGKRNLRLEVDRPGVQLRYRKSYSPRTANSELVDYAVSGLLFGQGSNALGVQLAVSEPKVDAKGAAQVTVTIDVPLEKLALLPVGEDRRGRFTVALSARQANGRYLPIGHRAIDVRASEVDQATQSFRYEVELPFRGKGLRLSAAVRDDVAGTRSLRLAEVNVGSS